MNVELVVSIGNLVALLGYFIRTENRLTRLETKIDFLFQRRRDGRLSDGEE